MSWLYHESWEAITDWEVRLPLEKKVFILILLWCNLPVEQHSYSNMHLTFEPQIPLSIDMHDIQDLIEPDFKMLLNTILFYNMMILFYTVMILFYTMMIPFHNTMIPFYNIVLQITLITQNTFFMAHRAIPMIAFPQVRTIYIYIYIFIFLCHLREYALYTYS